MLTLADVSKAYGTRPLFSEVSLFVSRKDRLGLVGANGAGKTTLFRLILGEEPADEGTITWERGADFGFLPQEGAPAGDETILQIALGTPAGGVDGGGHEAEGAAGFAGEARAKRILAGLGFRAGDFDRPARTFSGGWVMRARIARLLVAEPALLLLDEPTNHLDLEALLWLQDYLSRYPGGLLLISHDRAFLNALCTGILELRGGALERYMGDYDAYERERGARHERQLALFKSQQREIARLQRFVDRFGAKATLASRAKSKEKQIERLMEEAVEAPERDLRRISFRFPQPPRAGLRVMRLKDVFQSYGEHVVYDGGLSLDLGRGERVALVGPNGAGKSTLLKILGGVTPIQGGLREPGHNVTAGYFSQTRTDTLRVEATVLENVMELRTAENGLTEQAARTLLGAFLFRKDDVFKKVALLSGGEKSRLALARLLVNPPNLLLLDEPTTHLDMASIDALVLALSQFEGTVVFISHDVHFIRSVADKVLHVCAGRVTAYAGGYDYYLDKSRAGDARAALTAGFTDARPPQRGAGGGGGAAAAAAARSGPKSREQKRAEAEERARRAAPLREARARVAALEAEIAELERRQGELTAELERPETYGTPGLPQSLNRELGGVVKRLEEAAAEWEAAGREAERLEGK
jgi:ATP-binding cassette subfamily F protein 3